MSGVDAVSKAFTALFVDIGKGLQGVPKTIGWFYRESAALGKRVVSAFQAGDEKVAGLYGNLQTAESLVSKCTAGEPVDVATGDVVISQVDVELPGTLSLMIARVHRSGQLVGRWLGASWMCTLDQRLVVTPAGVSFVTQDGALLSYDHPWLDGELVWPASGSRWPLTREGRSYTITDPQTGVTWRFEPRPGHDRPAEGVGVLPLVLMTSRAGHQIRFEHGPDGVPVSVTHDGGYQILVAADGERVTGLALAAAGPGGADVPLVRYGYDGAGNLAEVINSSGLPMRYSYDELGRLTEWHDRNDWWYRYSYDEQGRCVRGEGPDGVLADSFRYDSDGRVTTHTDVTGAQTVYQLTDGYRVAAVTDPLGHVTSNDYDSSGELVSQADPLGRVTRWTHDRAGNLTAITRPDGSQVTATYNDQNLPVRITEPDGATWQQEYDEHGNLTRVTDPGGAVTSYGYDERGSLTSVTDPLGSVTVVECNRAGLVVSVTSPVGAVTSYERDGFGRVIAVTGPDGQVTRMARTPEGLLASRTFPDGTAERMTYDGEGNLVEHVDAAGGVTRYEYGFLDQPAAVTAPDGTRTDYAYDEARRLTAVTHAGLTWRYEYDLAGRIVAQTDCNGAATRYSLDAAGQITSRVNAAGQQVSYAYDVLGNRTEQYAGSAMTTFSHDAAGRLTRAQSPDALLEVDYDPAGRILAETINGATVRSRYDAAGRRVQRVTPSGAVTRWDYDPAGRPVVVQTAGQELQFDYNRSGQEILRLLPGGVTLAQDWDAAGQLTAQVLTASPEPGAEQPPPSAVLSRLGSPGAVARPAAGPVLQRRGYSYRDDGMLTGVDDLLSGRRVLSLDRAGRVSAVTGPGWSEAYGYDRAGNITTASWPAAAGGAGPGPVAAAGAQLPQGQLEYAGTLISRAGDIRYEHDAAGRVVLRQQARLSRKPDTWRYEWDADDRLTAVTTPDGTRWHYTYDALGRRIAKHRVNAAGNLIQQTTFSWDGPVLAEQATAGLGADPAPEHVTTWDCEPGTFTPLTQAEHWRYAPQEQVDDRFYAVISDLIGAPAELVSPGGDIAGQQRHTLWGTTFWSGVSSPLRFPGQYHDEETGLHYNQQRYYDPVTARYLSPDPLGLTPGPNPHAYVSNPTGMSDPLGLAGKKGTLKAGDVGSYEELAAKGTEADDLTPHHVPQAALGLTAYCKGGAIALPTAVHKLTRTHGTKGKATKIADAGLPLQTVLNKDYDDLRGISSQLAAQGTPLSFDMESKISAIQQYYETNFPNLLK